MDLHVQGFGVVALFTTGLGCGAAIALAIVAVVRLRHLDRLALAAITAGALLEFIAMGGEFFLLVIGSVAASAINDHYLAWLRLQDAWFISRPLIHAIALIAITVAVVRLSIGARRPY